LLPEGLGERYARHDEKADEGRQQEDVNANREQVGFRDVCNAIGARDPGPSKARQRDAGADEGEEADSADACADCGQRGDRQVSER
jgi:hypothetical protein